MLTHSYDQVRESFEHLIEHLQHVLPAQAPLHDFVHHNTLHGLQHLPFPDALKRSRKLTGNAGYLPNKTFREYYRQGRINDDDLDEAFNDSKDWQVDEVVFQVNQRIIQQRDVYRAALLAPLKPLTANQLNWQIEENQVLQYFQADVTEKSREQLRHCSKDFKQTPEESLIVADLWAASLESLGLEHYLVHPEELQDLSPEQAERMFDLLQDKETENANKASSKAEHLLQNHARKMGAKLFARVGKDLTLRAFVEILSGEDASENLDPMFIRYVSAWLDQGIAAWQPKEGQQGFYKAWKNSEKIDLFGLLEDMSDWYEQIASLPDDATATLISILTRMGIPEKRWTQYLQNLALELPGWSGMFLWRHFHPNYEGLKRPIDMLDYLAVRLVMEYFFVQQICRKHWLINASLFHLKKWFIDHKIELFVRYHLFKGDLPEYLIAQTQHLIGHTDSLHEHKSDWIELGQRLWTWQHSPAAIRPDGYSVSRSVWRLFSLMQHLGICGDGLRTLKSAQIETLFRCLKQVDDPENSGFLWLQAYEHHYHNEIFNATVHNHPKEPLHNFRGSQPSLADAQLIFCMDDREEAMRRHLEEINPNIETLGAAAFFNVIMNWQGLDDLTAKASCPVVATPVHKIREIAQTEQKTQKEKHDERRHKRLCLHNWVHQKARRNLLTTAVLMLVTLPVTFSVLLGKIFAPLGFSKLSHRIKQSIDLSVGTDIQFTAEQALNDKTASCNQAGFTEEEQIDRVEQFLRSIGLVRDYSTFVVTIGHGSISQNNPHRSAYNCGACSGRNSGPNARVFAAMANRPEIRRALAKRGLSIPDSCWFLGAMHNTADETILWYDTEKIPTALQTDFSRLQANVQEATLYSAQERCRKFASAPKKPSLKEAYQHVIMRTQDLSQVRPELGHVTNAVAFIGRRSLTRGVFWDRRAFLISYDYTTDPSSQILEAILLSAGPVGAGINLEYYFSMVDNQGYGCGPKTLHNVSGLLGVMEGGSSDLRTGLPWQMLDIHEAMRLQVIVEAKVETLVAIYQRQPPLQELVGKGWILLSAKDPDSDDIFVFKPDQGFVRWKGKRSALPEVSRSPEWYFDHYTHLSPATVKETQRSLPKSFQQG